MTPEVRQTLRHAGGLVLLRLVELTGSLMLITLVPRAMGPAVFGQFSLIQTLALAFSLISSMGAASLMTHYIPGFIERGDHDKVHQLAGGMLAFRTLGGVVASLSYFLLTVIWLREVDPAAIAFLAATIGVQTVANLPFTVLLGLNRAAHWGAAEALRRSLMAPALLLGWTLNGLRGACGGMLLIELFVVSLGLWWGRTFLFWSNFRIDLTFLRPYLRFSVSFFAGSILIMMCDRAGGPMVHLLSGEFREVGFYSLAYGAFLTGAQALWQLQNGLGPLLSSLRQRDDIAALMLWAKRVLILVGVLGILASATAYLFAERIVRLALGPGFDAVAPLLVLLSLAGILIGPGSFARMLCVVYNEPRVFITGAALQLSAFAVVTLALFPPLGSRGLATAVLVSTALFSGYTTWGVRRHLCYPLEPWAKVAALGLLCSPILWWSAAPTARWALFNVAFLASIFVARIITPQDVRAAWTAIRTTRR